MIRVMAARVLRLPRVPSGVARGSEDSREVSLKALRRRTVPSAQL